MRARQTHHKKRKQHVNIPDECRHKNPQQNTSKPNPTAQWKEWWLKTQKSINVIHHVNKTKNKNHLIVSVGAQEVFDKIQHSFMIKTLNTLGTEGKYLSVIKFSSEKSSEGSKGISLS